MRLPRRPTFLSTVADNQSRVPMTEVVVIVVMQVVTDLCPRCARSFSEPLESQSPLLHTAHNQPPLGDGVLHWDGKLCPYSILLWKYFTEAEAITSPRSSDLQLVQSQWSLRDRHRCCRGVRIQSRNVACLCRPRTWSGTAEGEMCKTAKSLPRGGIARGGLEGLTDTVHFFIWPQSYHLQNS